MEKYIRYKRFAKTCDEKGLQDFYDELIAEGWEIIYYKETQQPSGMLTKSPNEVVIHIVALCGKRQENNLKPIL